MNPADTRTAPEVPERLTKKLSVSWKVKNNAPRRFYRPSRKQ